MSDVTCPFCNRENRDVPCAVVGETLQCHWCRMVFVAEEYYDPMPIAGKPAEHSWKDTIRSHRKNPPPENHYVIAAQVVGWILIVLSGVLLLVLLSKELYAFAFAYFLSGAVGGVFFLCLSELIRLLNGIYRNTGRQGDKP